MNSLVIKEKKYTIINDFKEVYKIPVQMKKSYVSDINDHYFKPFEHMWMEKYFLQISFKKAYLFNGIQYIRLFNFEDFTFTLPSKEYGYINKLKLASFIDLVEDDVLFISFIFKIFNWLPSLVFNLFMLYFTYENCWVVYLIYFFQRLSTLSDKNIIGTKIQAYCGLFRDIISPNLIALLNYKIRQKFQSITVYCKGTSFPFIFSIESNDSTCDLKPIYYFWYMKIKRKDIFRPVGFSIYQIAQLENVLNCYYLELNSSEVKTNSKYCYFFILRSENTHCDQVKHSHERSHLQITLELFTLLTNYILLDSMVVLPLLYSFKNTKCIEIKREKIISLCNDIKSKSKQKNSDRSQKNESQPAHDKVSNTENDEGDKNTKNNTANNRNKQTEPNSPYFSQDDPNERQNRSCIDMNSFILILLIALYYISFYVLYIDNCYIKLIPIVIGLLISHLVNKKFTDSKLWQHRSIPAFVLSKTAIEISIFLCAYSNNLNTLKRHHCNCKVLCSILNIDKNRLAFCIICSSLNILRSVLTEHFSSRFDYRASTLLFKDVLMTSNMLAEIPYKNNKTHSRNYHSDISVDTRILNKTHVIDFSGENSIEESREIQNKTNAYSLNRNVSETRTNTTSSQSQNDRQEVKKTNYSSYGKCFRSYKSTVINLESSAKNDSITSLVYFCLLCNSEALRLLAWQYLKNKELIISNKFKETSFYNKYNDYLTQSSKNYNNAIDLHLKNTIKISVKEHDVLFITDEETLAFEHYSKDGFEQINLSTFQQDVEKLISEENINEITKESLQNLFSEDDARDIIDTLTYGLTQSLSYLEFCECFRQLNIEVNNIRCFINSNINIQRLIRLGFYTLFLFLVSTVLAEIVIQNSFYRSIVLPIVVFILPWVINLFDNFMFIVCMHPFDVGDRIYLKLAGPEKSNQQDHSLRNTVEFNDCLPIVSQKGSNYDNLIVKSIDLTCTIFERWNNEIVIYSNSCLKNQIIENVRRSQTQAWSLTSLLSSRYTDRKYDENVLSNLINDSCSSISFIKNANCNAGILGCSTNNKKASDRCFNNLEKTVSKKESSHIKYKYNINDMINTNEEIEGVCVHREKCKSDTKTSDEASLATNEQGNKKINQFKIRLNLQQKEIDQSKISNSVASYDISEKVSEKKYSKLDLLKILLHNKTKDLPGIVEVKVVENAIIDSFLLQIVIRVQHDITHQNGYFTWVVQNKFMKTLINILKRLEISYSPIEQHVEVSKILVE